MILRRFVYRRLMASLDSLSLKSIFRNRLLKDHDEDQVKLCLMTKSDENNKEDSIRKKRYIDSGMKTLIISPSL